LAIKESKTTTTPHRKKIQKTMIITTQRTKTEKKTTDVILLADTTERKTKDLRTGKSQDAYRMPLKKGSSPELVKKVQ
jgi:hypothetical protein